MKLFFVLIFLCGLAVGAYALLVEPFMLRIKHWTVSTSKWPHDKPLKIALISDVHAIWPWMTPSHVARVVEAANQQEPDLILLLGDYVGTHPFGVVLNPDDGVAPYKKLRARCGVFAIIGNHDVHRAKGWIEALTRTEIPVLNNRAVPIDCAGQKIWVAGLEELWWQHADIPKTLAQVTDSNPVILMMHNPDSFVDTPDRVALSVAGHTHGGQIRLPIIGAIRQVIPSKYGLRYVYGHIVEDDKDLVVSGGVGSTGVPLRFLMPPEITVVTLTRK